MSGSWDDMVADEARANGNPAYLPNAGAEQYVDRLKARRPLSSYGEVRKAFQAGVAWVTALQLEWESLTVPDAIWELRRGTDSVFWPLLAPLGDNPEIGVECPSDRTHNAGSIQPVNRDGHCLTCGYMHVEPATALRGDN